jgi:hypothetical protein
MTKQLRSTLVIACGLAAGCGSSDNNGNGIDAPGSRGDAPGSRDAATRDGSTSTDAPTDAPIIANGVIAIPLSTPTGGDQGEFYTPALTASGKSFLLDLDTGSTVTGIAGMSCTTCTGMSPLYTPGAGATTTNMADSASYADGSQWSGTVYSDMVGLGHGSPDVTLDFVNISSQTMFFSGNEYQGILGMGPDALLDPGTTAYPDQLFGAGVTTKTMAFELCPTDGTMWLGGYDATHAASAPKYTPILTTGDNAGFYEVNMTGMSLGTTSLGVASATFDNPIVDTGTSLFYIPNTAETALIHDINANAGYKALFPAQTLTDPTNSNSQTAGCVNATAGTTDAMVDAMLPALSETFAGVGGGSISISAAPLASYFQSAGGGQYCLVVFGGGDHGNATMGDTFMRGFVTIIDLDNMKVGFAPTAHCTAPAADVAHGPMRERGRGPHHVRRSGRRT